MIDYDIEVTKSTPDQNPVGNPREAHERANVTPNVGQQLEIKLSTSDVYFSA